MPVSLFTDGIEPVDQEAVIWRYMDLRKFRDLLTGQLYFRRADKFDDMTEGLPPEEYERVLNLNRYDINDIRQRNYSIGFIAQMRQAYYISCWYLFSEETAGMWGAYGKDGVAVCSRYSLLKSALEPLVADDARLGLVQYGSAHLRRWNLMTFVSTKQTKYEDEKEVRAMLWIRDPHESGNRHLDPDNRVHDRPIYDTQNPPGVKRPVDVGALITEVVVSPFAGPGVFADVENSIREAGHEFAVKPSSLTQFASFVPTAEELSRYK